MVLNPASNPISVSLVLIFLDGKFSPFAHCVFLMVRQKTPKTGVWFEKAEES